MSSLGLSDEYNFSPRSVRWIETLFWKGVVCPVELNVGQCTPSFEVSVDSINANLTFVLKKKNAEILTLSCVRDLIRDEPRDDDYYIQFYFTLFNFEERPRLGVMKFQRNTIDLDYDMQNFCDLGVPEYHTLMKCFIRVVELEDTSNSELLKQEEELFRMTREVCTSDDQLTEMAYVLRRPHLGDVYTGRMDPSSASLMCTFIANACSYSTHIYEFIKARDKSYPVNHNIFLTEILSGIYGTQRFNDNKCSILFIEAHMLGLEFLRILCAAYFIRKLNDDNVTDLLILADWTEDRELFRAAAEYFMAKHWVIRDSPKWTLWNQRDESCLQRIVENIEYRSVNNDWYFPPLPEDEVG